MSITMEKTVEIPAAPKTALDRDFSVGFRRSLYFHLTILAFVLLKSLVFPGSSTSYTPTLRVDLVGLPDLLKKDLANVAKFPPPPGELPDTNESKAKTPKPLPAETTSKDEMVLKPKKKAESNKRLTHDKTRREIEKQNQNALARIKALARIGVDTPNNDRPQSQGQLIKGNAISKGTSLSGDAREATNASYFDQLRDRLQESWALPIWVARQNLSARVQIFIDSRGMLRSFRFMKPSGNPQFDKAVKKTLIESQPYPIPPEGIATNVLADGILVGFPL